MRLVEGHDLGHLGGASGAYTGQEQIILEGGVEVSEQRLKLEKEVADVTKEQVRRDYMFEVSDVHSGSPHHDPPAIPATLRAVENSKV